MVVKVSEENTKQQIVSCKQRLEKEEDNDATFALIIDGQALNYVLGKNVEGDLMELAIKCASVICCRVSPKQKAVVSGFHFWHAEGRA